MESQQLCDVVMENLPVGFSRVERDGIIRAFIQLRRPFRGGMHTGERLHLHVHIAVERIITGIIKNNPGSKEAVMRKARMISIAVALSVLFVVSAALAGPWMGWRGSGGWGMGSSYQRMYNPATVETVSGVVESVDKITPMKGMNSGIHIALKTDKETIAVHLGPEWYIERQDVKLEKGDTIEVKGSRVTFDGKPAIIAAECKKGDSVLILRDGAGFPAWAGWRR